MSDLIERDKAIDAIRNHIKDIDGDDDALDYIATNMLKDVPSARPNNRGICGVCAGRKVCGKNNRNLDMLECSIFELDENYKILRPKGEWRGEHKMPDMPRYEWYRCSECNFLSQSVVNYCPNCGADMREREGE